MSSRYKAHIAKRTHNQTFAEKHRKPTSEEKRHRHQQKKSLSYARPIIVPRPPSQNARRTNWEE